MSARPSNTKSVCQTALGVSGLLATLLIVIGGIDVVYGGHNLAALTAFSESIGVGAALVAATGGSTVAMGGRAVAQHWTSITPDRGEE
jgi:hypothetical protein